MRISIWLLICCSILLMQRCTGQFDDDKVGHRRRKGGSRSGSQSNSGRLAELDDSTQGIVNGRNSKQGERSYQVSLQMYDQHFCGGSVLNSRYILTAAHCVVSQTGEVKNPSDVKVIAGTLHVKLRYRTYQASKIIPHKDYNYNDSFRNDIALIQVDKPISFDKFIKPITLPDSTTKVNDGDTVTVSGYGNNKYYRLTYRLKEVDIKIVNQEKCKEKVESYKRVNYTVYPTQLCVQDDDRSQQRGSCNGDSGGALVNKNKVIIGIVSWTIKIPNCGSTEYPSIYTRVTEYLDWIKSNQQ